MCGFHRCRVGGLLMRMAGVVILTLLGVARAQNDFVAKLDRFGYSDSVGRGIDYGFDSGQITQDGNGLDMIVIPTGAIQSRATGEEGTNWVWCEPIADADTNASLGGGVLNIGIPQTEPAERMGVWALVNQGSALQASDNWMYRADFLGFTGTGIDGRVYSVGITGGSSLPDVQPQISATWYTGWYDGVHYTDVLVLEARLEDEVSGQIWTSGEVSLFDHEPGTTALSLRIEVSGGNAFTASYLLDGGDWQTLWQQTAATGQVRGFPEHVPTLWVRTHGTGIADLVVARGSVAGDVPTREYSVEVSGSDLTRLHMITPWGVQVDSASYLPADWDGQVFEVDDPALGLHLEADSEDGLRLLEFEWEDLTEVQRAAVDTTNAYIAVYWEGGSWNGMVNFGSSPMPTQTPVITTPTAGATDVDVQPWFSWQQWTDPGTEAPGLWWSLERDDGREVYEEDHAAAATTWWQQLEPLLPGTGYRFSINFHHAPVETVNGVNVRVVSWLESEARHFRTAGTAPLYAVWGGVTDYTGNPDVFDNPHDTDYSFIAYGSGSDSFPGGFDYYVIVPVDVVYVDAVAGPGSAWYQGALWSGDTDDPERLLGAPDGQAATVRGYALFANPGTWDLFSVWTLTAPVWLPNLVSQLNVPATLNAVAGQQLSVATEVRNTGTARATDRDDPGTPWDAAVYLSADLAFDREADTRLAGFGIAYIDPAQSQAADLSIRAPTTPGTYYLAALADPDNRVDEIHENDNWSNPVTLVVGAGQLHEVTLSRGIDSHGTWDHGIEVVADGLSELHVTTPWGATVNVAGYLPLVWNGEAVATWDPANGIDFEAYTNGDGRRVMEMYWKAMDAAQWASLDTGQTTIAVAWNGGSWTGTTDFAAAPLPAQAPRIASPADGAAAVDPSPWFSWTLWQDPGPANPGVWWLLEDLTNCRDVHEEDHAPANTATWIPPAPLAQGTDYRFTADYHYLPNVSVAGRDVRVGSYVESAPVHFHTLGDTPVYEVWGGDTDYTAEPTRLLDPAGQTDYTFLGAAAGTATFHGSHRFYLVHPVPEVRVDALQGSNSAFHNEALWTGDTDNSWDALGGPDGAPATVRGYLVFVNPNNWTSLKVYTVGAVQPDLVTAIPGVTVIQAIAEEILEFDIQVTNSGDGVANPGAPWFTCCYLSADPAFDVNADAFLGSFETMYLGVGQTVAGSVGFTVPRQAGTYYLAARADRDDLVAERNETNNWSNTVTIEVGPPAPPIVQLTCAVADDGKVREYDVGVTVAGLTRIEIITPWGETWDSDWFAIPAGIGLDVALYDDTHDLWLEVRDEYGRRTFNMCRDNLTAPQWAAIDAAPTGVTAEYAGTAWGGAPWFMAPVPASLPTVTTPAAEATDVVLTPEIAWQPWTDPGLSSPTIEWRLADAPGNTVYEVAGMAAATTSWQVPNPLAGNTTYEFQLQFVNHFSGAVNGAMVVRRAYTEGTVSFTTTPGGAGTALPCTFVAGYNLLGFPLTGTTLNSAAAVLAWAPNATAVYAFDPAGQAWVAHTATGGTDFPVYTGMALFVACTQPGSVAMHGQLATLTAHPFSSPGCALLCLPHNAGMLDHADALIGNIPGAEGVWRWLPEEQRWSGCHAGFGGDNFALVGGTPFMVAVDAPGTWHTPAD